MKKSTLVSKIISKKNCDGYFLKKLINSLIQSLPTKPKNEVRKN